MLLLSMFCCYFDCLAFGIVASWWNHYFNVSSLGSFQETTRALQVLPYSLGAMLWIVATADVPLGIGVQLDRVMPYVVQV